MQLNPFLSVWTKPKETIRQIVETKTIWFAIFIGAIGGIGSLLSGFQDSGISPTLSFGLILVLSFIAGPIIGALSSLITGAFYTWVGRLLGGTGEMKDMIKATAAMYIPLIPMAIVYIIFALVYGELFFVAPEPLSYELSSIPTGAYMLLISISLFFGIWSTIIACKGIGIVHNFSSWRGLGTILILAVIVFITSLVVGLLVISFLLI